MNKEKLEHCIWYLKSEIDYNLETKKLVKKYKLKPEKKYMEIPDLCIKNCKMMIRIYEQMIKDVVKKEAKILA